MRDWTLLFLACLPLAAVEKAAYDGNGRKAAASLLIADLAKRSGS